MLLLSCPARWWPVVRRPCWSTRLPTTSSSSGCCLAAPFFYFSSIASACLRVAPTHEHEQLFKPAPTTAKHANASFVGVSDLASQSSLSTTTRCSLTHLQPHNAQAQHQVFTSPIPPTLAVPPWPAALLHPSQAHSFQGAQQLLSGRTASHQIFFVCRGKSSVCVLSRGGFLSGVSGCSPRRSHFFNTLYYPCHQRRLHPPPPPPPGSERAGGRLRRLRPASRLLGIATTGTRLASSASPTTSRALATPRLRRMARDGILTSAAGKVTLLTPADMPEDYVVRRRPRRRLGGAPPPVRASSNATACRSPARS